MNRKWLHAYAIKCLNNSSYVGIGILLAMIIMDHHYEQHYENKMLIYKAYRDARESVLEQAFNESRTKCAQEVHHE